MKAYPERKIADRQTHIGNRVCSACGAQAQRRFAKYCLDCGKSLLEDYKPLDNLRASYRLLGENFQSKPIPQTETANLFEKRENAALELAWAFLVYSMIPYLGILFLPGAVFMGSLGALKACNPPNYDDLKSASYVVLLSFLFLSVQFLLWWLLYIIPEI